MRTEPHSETGSSPRVRTLLGVPDFPRVCARIVTVMPENGCRRDNIPHIIRPAMSAEIIDYCVMNSYNAGRLVAKVRSGMNKGWTPQGGVTERKGRLYQTMVKYGW